MLQTRRYKALDRRELLSGGATVLGTFLLPPRTSAAAVPVSPMMATLSGYMAAAGDRSLPEDVVEKAKHHILDTFAAMISGSRLAPAQAALKFARDYAADSTATIAASKLTATPLEAALVNGMLAHSDETDDSNEFSQSHPGCAVVPPDARPQLMIEQLGERFEIARTNIKKWTVGSPIQAPLDAMSNIFAKRQVSPDEVKTIVVRLAHTEARTVNNRDMPDICLQHMIAVMLLDKTASFKAAHDQPRMNDPAVLRQRAKVQLIESEALEKLEPARQAIVEITLDDGSVLSDRVTAVRGTVDNPMPRDEVIRKPRDLCEPIIGKDQTEALVTQTLALERLADIRDLRSLLQTA